MPITCRGASARVVIKNTYLEVKQLDYRNEVIISSFLVDFERFYEQGTEFFLRKYEHLFKKYCNFEALLNIILSITGQDIILPDELAMAADCVKEAREISLTQTDKSGGINDSQGNRKNLTSVFFRVNISDNNTCKKQKYNFNALTPHNCFPVNMRASSEKQQKREDEKRQKEQTKLIHDFEDEMNNLSIHAPEQLEQFLIPFEMLLKKYLWCITASDYEGEDISLYDHARITAAIADSLYIMKGEKEKDVYKLVAGNFSGIQRYIFSLSSVNTSKVAKKLRARSFFVDATVEIFAQYIIDRFEVPRFHILMLTGGKFYILLPNIEESDCLLEEIEQIVEKELFSKFKGQLSTNLAFLNCGRKGLEKYDDSISELSERLNGKKKQPFHLVLAEEDGWNEEKFCVEKELSGRKRCPSCRMVFMENSRQEQCEICAEQERLGQMLPNAKYLAYFRGHEDDIITANKEFKLFLGYSLRILKADKPNFDDAYYIEQIQGSDIKAECLNYPIMSHYLGNHIPVDAKGIPQSFDDLAETEEGKPYMAVLKADVDNLGYIFSNGLKSGDKHWGTISRINTMSRLLTVFFSGKVQELLTEISGEDSTAEYEKVYSVFAGGDDLFLIGPWSKMIDLAKRINSEFKKFVCHNGDITLSATIDLYHPKTHIATMAEKSEEHLSKVKNLTKSPVKKEGRNGVQFFGQVFGWDDFEEQTRNAEILAMLMKEHDTGVDVTMLRRVCEYSQMYQEYLIDGNTNKLIFKSRLHYVLGRNEKKKIVSYFQKLSKVEKEDAVNVELYYASSMMNNVLMRTRK